MDRTGCHHRHRTRLQVRLDHGPSAAPATTTAAGLERRTIALSAGARRSRSPPSARSRLTGDTATGTGSAEGHRRALAVAAFAPDARWVLRFTGIRSKGPALTSYDVYLGLDAGAAADPEDADHYVGLLSLFGVYEASRDDGTSSGAGRMESSTSRRRCRRSAVASTSVQRRCGSYH